MQGSRSATGHFDGRYHVIGLVEVYAAIVALRYWRRRLEGRRVILFVDNWPALDARVPSNIEVKCGRWPQSRIHRCRDAARNVCNSSPASVPDGKRSETESARCRRSVMSAMQIHAQFTDFADIDLMSCFSDLADMSSCCLDDCIRFHVV